MKERQGVQKPQNWRISLNVWLIVLPKSESRLIPPWDEGWGGVKKRKRQRWKWGSNGFSHAIVWVSGSQGDKDETDDCWSHEQRITSAPGRPLFSIQCKPGLGQKASGLSIDGATADLNFHTSIHPHFVFQWWPVDSFYCRTVIQRDVKQTFMMQVNSQNLSKIAQNFLSVLPLYFVWIVGPALISWSY